ncbi:diguanylate cyclase domain-containing protein [Shewanella sp. SR44-3]|uniref:sensor domain-containing phosphodiesterase n=1 Tax=Shewanella sp. SR44-3 TaxID=2760936 RepID=UPI0015F80F2A|nr:diguanylate cyclase [Shewanella sp. SR44-3]MBB1269342.1 diguanylate cyclase [Shewanella sp. SR44-3]
MDIAPSFISSDIEHLQKRVIRLKRLARKYKRAEIIQNALLEISNIATKAASLDLFYQGVHLHLKKLIPADNFFIASRDANTGLISLPFFADEKDPHPSELYPDEEISSIIERGITGYVLKTGVPLLCDTAQFDQLIATGAIDDLGSPSHQWLGVPIKRNNISIGVLVVQSYHPDITYGELELELMGFICHHISGVMERLKHNEQLEQAITQRTKELSHAYETVKQEIKERVRAERLQKALFEIADLTASNADQNSFYVQLHQVISQLIPAQNCFIALINKEDASLSFPFYVSQMNLTYPASRPMQDGLTEYILATKQPKLLSQKDIQTLIDQDEIYAIAPSLNQTHAMHQWIGIPLFIHGSIAGALTIYSISQDQNYQPKDLELLNFVSLHIANAIERKMAVEVLKRSHDELEDKVIQRTQALAELNDNLQQEIMQRRKIEAQLLHDAKHDGLTGLPNRSFCMERLAQAIKHCRRHSQDQFALLFIDLDRFKQINDTFGHLEGDKFLIETARRLKSCIRENDTLARLGGDEFVILLDTIQGTQDALDVGDRILHQVSQPYKLGKQDFISGASIGIAFSGSHKDETSESLLKDADAAMYQAKSKGKGCYVIFDSQIDKRAKQAAEMKKAFKRALLQQEITISYAPVMNFNDLSIIALEPQATWKHPDGSLKTHNQLKLLAEQCQLIIHFDAYIFDHLNHHYAALTEQFSSKICIHLSVSSQHIKHKHGLRNLKRTLKKSQLDLSNIWVFFHEKSFVQDTENHISAFQHLSQMTVNIGMNGYGTGYSSLSSLSLLPISALKLDSNISKHLVNEQQLQLTKAYQLAATSLGVDMFVEGVDTMQQKRQLSQLGYQQGQGKTFEKKHLHYIKVQKNCA